MPNCYFLCPISAQFPREAQLEQPPQPHAAPEALRFTRLRIAKNSIAPTSANSA